MRTINPENVTSSGTYDIIRIASLDQNPEMIKLWQKDYDVIATDWPRSVNLIKQLEIK
jgi:hypothetical protein